MYYVYAYLRNRTSVTAKAGSPYYIGKGTGNRAWDLHSSNIQVPTDKDMIVILENNLTELGALALERRYIKWYGRKDLGTGILLNRTAGGDGASGHVPSDAQRKQVSERLKGKSKSEETKKKMSLSKKGLPSNIKGKTMSIEARNRISEVAKQRSEKDIFYKDKMSRSLKKYYLENPKDSQKQEQTICPHCNKIGGSHAMKRWHFDNCKVLG